MEEFTSSAIWLQDLLTNRVGENFGVDIGRESVPVTGRPSTLIVPYPDGDLRGAMKNLNDLEWEMLNKTQQLVDTGRPSILAGRESLGLIPDSVLQNCSFGSDGGTEDLLLNGGFLNTTISPCDNWRFNNGGSSSVHNRLQEVQNRVRSMPTLDEEDLQQTFYCQSNRGSDKTFIGVPNDEELLNDTFANNTFDIKTVESVEAQNEKEDSNKSDNSSPKIIENTLPPCFEISSENEEPFIDNKVILSHMEQNTQTDSPPKDDQNSPLSTTKTFSDNIPETPFQQDDLSLIAYLLDKINKSNVYNESIKEECNKLLKKVTLLLSDDKSETFLLNKTNTSGNSLNAMTPKDSIVVTNQTHLVKSTSMESLPLDLSMKMSEKTSTKLSQSFQDVSIAKNTTYESRPQSKITLKEPSKLGNMNTFKPKCKIFKKTSEVAESINRGPLRAFAGAATIVKKAPISKTEAERTKSLKTPDSEQGRRPVAQSTPQEDDQKVGKVYFATSPLARPRSVKNQQQKENDRTQIIQKDVASNNLTRPKSIGQAKLREIQTKARGSSLTRRDSGRSIPPVQCNAPVVAGPSGVSRFSRLYTGIKPTTLLGKLNKGRSKQ